MNRTVTIEIADTAVLQLLRSLASMSLIKFTQEFMSEDDDTALINKICEEVDTSLDPSLMAAQAEVLGTEDW